MRSMLLLTAVLALAPGAALAQTFSTLMNVEQATTCGASDAQGSGVFTYDDATSAFTWNITFGRNAPDYNDGLLAQGSETVSHIHVGAPGQTGGTTIDLALGNPKVGNATLSAQQETELLAGLWYVNIHSTNCGGGEIRGQIVPAAPGLPGPFLALAALTMLGALALLSARLRRKTLY